MLQAFLPSLGLSRAWMYLHQLPRALAMQVLQYTIGYTAEENSLFSAFLMVFFFGVDGIQPFVYALVRRSSDDPRG